MSIIQRACVAGLLLALAGVGAQAAPLFPGGALFPAPAEPDPVSATLVAAVSAPYSLPGSLSGILISKVYSGDATNPFGLNALTFTYEINNSAMSDAIGRFTITGYLGVITDASFNPLGIGVPPALIDRNTPDVVGFDFAPIIGQGPIPPGVSSKVLVIQTNATQFAPSIGYFIDGGIASAEALAPVPEPASAGLVVAGMMIVMARRRRGA